MTSEIGNLLLAAATPIAGVALLQALLAVWLDKAGALNLARWLVTGYFAAMSLAAAALLYALLQNDFSLAYVAKFSERALPTGYKIAAFWAGQEGSLLLWAWLLGLAATVAAWQWRARLDKACPWTLATLALICLFFGALMLFAANPFELGLRLVEGHWITVRPADGHGLNPLLQDPGMIAHPPLLFAGYALFAVPFALLIGNLCAGTKGDTWVKPMRRWLLVAWIFLGLGILLGANWAYTVLGWGGYWAWDPVENASLLPWLTSTALLHSLGAQEQRGQFRRWNAGLISASFILCLVGTYITRSGVIQSVHAFGASNIGTFFLVFLLVCLVLSAGLILGRNKELNSAQPLDGLISRDGAFLSINVLLSLITMVVLVGTVFPLISTVISGQAVEVKPSFFNTVVSPLAGLVLALMAFGPLLPSGAHAGAELLKRLPLPAGLTMAATLAVCVMRKLVDPWSVATVAVVAMTISAVICELIRGVRQRMIERSENPATALLRLLDGSHRRYGAQIAHLGMALLLAGVVGSSLWTQKQTLTLNVGQETQFAGMTLTLDELGDVRGPNYSATQARLTLIDAAGRQTTLEPQQRRYDQWLEQPNTIVALQSTLGRDVYVTLAGAENSTAAFQVILNPLAVWIWIGGLIVVLGGLYGLLPTLLNRAWVAATEKGLGVKDWGLGKKSGNV